MKRQSFSLRVTLKGCRKEGSSIVREDTQSSSMRDPVGRHAYNWKRRRKNRQRLISFWLCCLSCDNNKSSAFSFYRRGKQTHLADFVVVVVLLVDHVSDVSSNREPETEKLLSTLSHRSLVVSHEKNQYSKIGRTKVGPFTWRHQF